MMWSMSSERVMLVMVITRAVIFVAFGIVIIVVV